MQDLVDAILHLGHLPSQASSSSAEEKRLAARLIRARKAGALTRQQEANLRALQPDTGVEQEDSDAGASASRQQAAAGGASESVAADSPGEKAECKALAKQKAEQKADLKRRQKTAEIMEQVRKLGRYPKEYAGRSLEERQLAENAAGPGAPTISETSPRDAVAACPPAAALLSLPTAESSPPVDKKALLRIVQILRRMRVSAIRDIVQAGTDSDSCNCGDDVLFSAWNPRRLAKLRARRPKDMVELVFDAWYRVPNDEPKYCRLCDMTVNRGQWPEHTYTRKHLKNMKRNMMQRPAATATGLVLG